METSPDSQFYFERPGNNHTSGREPFVPEHIDRLASTESLQHRFVLDFI